MKALESLWSLNARRTGEALLAIFPVEARHARDAGNALRTRESREAGEALGTRLAWKALLPLFTVLADRARKPRGGGPLGRVVDVGNEDSPG